MTSLKALFKKEIETLLFRGGFDVDLKSNNLREYLVYSAEIACPIDYFVVKGYSCLSILHSHRCASELYRQPFSKFPIVDYAIRFR